MIPSSNLHTPDNSGNSPRFIKPGYEVSFFITEGNLHRMDGSVVYPVHLAGRMPPDPCPDTQTTVYYFQTPTENGHVLLHWHELDTTDE